MSSFRINKTPSGKWRVLEECWENGEAKDRTVPVAAYKSIGLNPESTIDEARKRIKEINALNRLERVKSTEAARRSERIGLVDRLLFPEEAIVAFTERVRVHTAGSPEHTKRLFVHFRFIQRMVLKLEVQPKDYADRADYFYKYFIDKRVSVDYAKKLIQMLNMWGKFVSKKNGTFFDPVPMPRRKMRSTMAKIQRTKGGVRREAERLTLVLLNQLKQNLPVEQYRWVYVSLWLGLRPIEVDQIIGRPEVIRNKSAIDVLVVNQTKIESEDEAEGYKYIPILYPEQHTALNYLATGALMRPRPKMLRAASSQAIDTYSGRKGFADLMQSLGQRLEDVSLWLGHKDIKTTLESYKDPANVPFTPTKKQSA